MGFTTGGSGFTGGGAGGTNNFGDKEDHGINLKHDLLSALSRPGQAVMQGLHPFSGTKGQITPDIILQSLKGAAHGLTDLSGAGDINAFEMENKVKPTGGGIGRAANIADFATQVALDPTNVIGLGGGTLAKTGLKILGRENAAIAEAIARKGATGLSAEHKAQAAAILAKSPEAAKVASKGKITAEEYAQKILGGGASKTGLGKNIGALEQAPGLKIAGKTVVSSKRLGETAAGKAVGAAKASKAGQLTADILNVRSHIGRAFGKGTEESVRQAELEANALKDEIVADAKNKLTPFINKIPKEHLARINDAFEKGTAEKLAQQLEQAGDTVSADFIRTRQAVEEGLSDVNLAKRAVAGPTAKLVVDRLKGDVQKIGERAPETFNVGAQQSMFGNAAEDAVSSLPIADTLKARAILDVAPETTYKTAGMRGAEEFTVHQQQQLFNALNRAAHTLTPQGERFLKENAVNPDFPAGATALEKNQILKNLTGKDFDFYDLDPVRNLMRNVVQKAGETGKQKLIAGLQDIKDGSGNPLASIAQKDGYETLNTPAGTFYAPPAVKTYLGRLSAKFDDPAEMKQLGKVVDGFDAVWKSGATSALFLGGLPFQIHNMVGNMVNMWMAGFNDPRYFKEAKGLRDVVQKAAKEGTSVRSAIEASNLTDLEKGAIHKAMDKGIISDAYFRSEFGVPHVNVAKGSKYKDAVNVIDTLSGAKVGKKAASFLEENMRLAMFLHGLAKTGSAEAAEELVKDSLFNYQDLSPALRKVKKLSPFLCMPEDHQILTQSGWKVHQDLEIGELVMVFDPQTHEMRWEPVLDIYRYPFEGELWTLDRKGGSFEFTEDHRWPFENSKTFVKGKNYGGQRGILPANELTKQARIPVQGEFLGTESILSPRHAAILGWIVTDGHGRWRGKNQSHFEACVYQSPKKFLSAVQELLGSQGTPHPQTGVYQIPVRAADHNVITKVYHDKTDLPGIVSKLSREAAEAMYEAMMMAEGTTTVRERSGRQSKDIQESFVQVEGPVLDAFQILCYMTGRSGWTSASQKIDGIIGGKHMTSDLDFRTITVRQSKALNVAQGFGRKQYTGVIWCPQTPTGTWIVKHDGAVLPTGNTWNKNNIPFQMKMLAQVPGKSRAIENFQNALLQNPNAPEDWQEDMPPWAKAANMSYLGSVEGSPLYGTFPTPLTSATDQLGGIADVLSGNPKAGYGTLINNLGGIRGSAVKQAVGEATGADPFTGKKLDEGAWGFEGQLGRDASTLTPGFSKSSKIYQGVVQHKKGDQQRAAKLLAQLGITTTYTSN